MHDLQLMIFQMAKNNGEAQSTHILLDKMTAILAHGIFECIFMNETFCILIQVSLKCVPKDPLDNKSA